MTHFQFTVFEYAGPMAHPVAMSTGTVCEAQGLIVRVTDPEGRQGWGEAAAAPFMTGETHAGMFAAAAYLLPLLKLPPHPGPVDIAALHDDMDRHLPHNPAVKAAIDIALHDLAGHRLGLPASALLGDRLRDRIGVLALIGTGSLAGDVRRAQELFTAGYRAFKAKVGTGSVAGDAERVRAIRAALGVEVLLGADANGAWNAGQARDFLALAGEARLDYLEQPLPPALMAEGALLHRVWGIPIGLDESLGDFADLARAHCIGAAQGGSFKLLKAGGMARLAASVQAACAAGMAVNLAGKVAETGIATAALLQVAAVCPAVPWGCSPANGYLVRDLVSPGLSVEGGEISIPTGPGLGIAVDEKRVREHALAVVDIQVNIQANIQPGP
jgi:o-succinylbenzoate synthase